MTAPQEAVQAVMGLLKCYVRHRPEVDVCGTCDSREVWTDRGCPVAASLADAVWAMAAHCGCEYCTGETTDDGECGCEFCEHRRSGDVPMLGSCCVNVSTPECQCKRKTNWGIDWAEFHHTHRSKRGLTHIGRMETCVSMDCQ